MTERQSALIELLERPDDPDLRPRVHTVTMEGDEKREALKGELEGAFLAYTLIDLEESVRAK